MSNFESGRTKVPTSSQASAADVSQSVSSFSNNRANTVKTPATGTSSEQSEQVVSVAIETTAAEHSPSVAPMSDDDLAKVLNIKSLKVKELESAVLQAQMSRNGQRQ